MRRIFTCVFIGLFACALSFGAAFADSAGCTGANYLSGSECVPCPSGYDYNTTDGKTLATQCQIHCDGGTYVATANDAACNNVGVGYWVAESTVNYGSVGTRTQCPTGLTTIGYGHGADEANDCGRILHVGDDVLYARSNKVTTPSLNFKIADGNVLYISLATDR